MERYFSFGENTENNKKWAYDTLITVGQLRNSIIALIAGICSEPYSFDNAYKE